MLNKFTPGPWEVRCSASGNINVVRESAPYGEDTDIICRVSDVLSQTAEDKANAQLIAAARTMIEALLKIKQYVDGVNLSSLHPNAVEMYDVIVGNIECLYNSAIAKALGEKEVSHG